MGGESGSVRSCRGRCCCLQINPRRSHSVALWCRPPDARIHWPVSRNPSSAAVQPSSSISSVLRPRCLKRFCPLLSSLMQDPETVSLIPRPHVHKKKKKKKEKKKKKKEKEKETCLDPRHTHTRSHSLTHTHMHPSIHPCIHARGVGVHIRWQTVRRMALRPQQPAPTRRRSVFPASAPLSRSLSLSLSLSSVTRLAYYCSLLLLLSGPH